MGAVNFPSFTRGFLTVRSRRKKLSNESVDLGLSSILGGAPSPSVPKDESTGAPETASSSLSIFTLEDSAATADPEPLPIPIPPTPPARTPHSILADGGNWAELSALTERELSSIGDVSPESRLWWILSQFYLESMPLSVLAAPLEESTRALEGQRDMSSSLRDLAGRVLVTVGQKLAGAGSVDGERLLARAHALLEHENENASRIEVKSFEPLQTDTPSPRAGTTTAEILFTPLASTPRSRTYLYGGGTIAALLLFWMMLPHSYISGKDTLVMTGGESEVMRSLPSMEVPLPSPLTAVGHLEALYYDVNRELTPASPQGVAPQPVKIIPEQSAPPIVAPAVIHDKRDVVNTSYPLESREIEAAIEGRNSPRRDERRDDVNWDGSFDSHDAFGDRERERERDRTRDRVRDYDRDRHHDTGFDNDFGRGDRYEIVINTSVMERPSFNGAEVASLYSGDVVVVESRLGRWLKIVSVKGVPGYIRAQDAERLSGD